MIEQPIKTDWAKEPGKRFIHTQYVDKLGVLMVMQGYYSVERGGFVVTCDTVPAIDMPTASESSQ